jgi:hypothetical protein
MANRRLLLLLLLLGHWHWQHAALLGLLPLLLPQRPSTREGQELLRLTSSRQQDLLLLLLINGSLFKWRALDALLLLLLPGLLCCALQCLL